MRIDEVKKLIENSSLDVYSLHLALSVLPFDHIKNYLQEEFYFVSFDSFGNANFIRPSPMELKLIFDNKGLCSLLKALKIETEVEFFDPP